jgi:hypothetical protein
MLPAYAKDLFLNSSYDTLGVIYNSSQNYIHSAQVSPKKIKNYEWRWGSSQVKGKYGSPSRQSPVDQLE